MSRLREEITEYAKKAKDRGDSIEQIESDLHIDVYEALREAFPEEELP